jgi:transcriptional regulator with XRE-family HTH domain
MGRYHGGHMREWRRQMKWTQQMLAEAWKVKVDFLRTFEREETEVTDPDIQRYADIFGVSFEEAISALEKILLQETGEDNGNVVDLLAIRNTEDQTPLKLTDGKLTEASQVKAYEIGPGVLRVERYDAPEILGKLTYTNGKSLQLSTEEWERVGLELTLPYALDDAHREVRSGSGTIRLGNFEETRKKAIELVRETILDEVRKILYATEERFRRQGEEHGDITRVSKNGGGATETVSGDVASGGKSLPNHPAANGDFLP